MSSRWGPNLSEEARYLLGKMPEEELDMFRDRILNDSEIADRVQDTENDLIDSYVRNELPPTLCNEVERRILNQASIRHRLKFAAALNNLQPKRSPRPAYKVLGAIAASIVIATIVGFFWTQQNRTNEPKSPSTIAQIILPGVTTRSQKSIPAFDRPAAEIIAIRVPWQQYIGTDLQATISDGAGRVLWKGLAEVNIPRTFVEIRVPRTSLVGSTFELALLKTDSGVALAYAYFQFR